MNYMRMALELAEKGRFTVAPNPMVGCIIERDRQVVGKGWHQFPGGPHAEIVALRAAGEYARGANLYISLEPCCHYGRTPPCVDELIAAKIKEVHIAVLDPNPLVNGRSVKKLLAAGIKVYLGAEAKFAEEQNAVFFHSIISKKPYVIAKWAMSIDGKIAAQNGSSKWISNDESRKHAHLTRSWLGSVLVGANTIIQDNPNLTPYLLCSSNRISQNFARIILDPLGESPLVSNVFKSDIRTIVVTSNKSDANWRKELKLKGTNILIEEINEFGLFNLDSLLTTLCKAGISGILVEGGQATLTSFVHAKLINKLHVYIAPKLLGGDAALTPVADIGVKNILEAPQLTNVKTELLGNDVFLEATPIW